MLAPTREEVLLVRSVQRLLKLSDEYKALKSNPDPMYSGEYDEEVFEYLDALRTEFSGKSVSEMTLEELTDLYRTMRAIDETLRDARKLIGWSEAETVYEAGTPSRLTLPPPPLSSSAAPSATTATWPAPVCPPGLPTMTPALSSLWLPLLPT